MLMPPWDLNSRPLDKWDVCQKPKRYVITATIFYFILYIFPQNFEFLECSLSKIATFQHLSLKFPKSWDSKLYFNISLMNLRSPAPNKSWSKKAKFSILKSLFCTILTKMLKYKYQFWHGNHKHKPFYDATSLILVKNIALKVKNSAFEK